jgi:hypothetical protein
MSGAEKWWEGKKTKMIAAQEKKSHTLNNIYCGAPSW